MVMAIEDSTKLASRSLEALLQYGKIERIVRFNRFCFTNE